MLNPFQIRRPANNWVVPVSLLMLIVGFLFSTAYSVTARSNQIQESLRGQFSATELPQLITDQELGRKLGEQKNEILKLRGDIAALQSKLADGSSASKEINKTLKENNLFAGLTEVEGPGITVTLSDSKKSDLPSSEMGTIHDNDIIKVVNELYAAGAEAIAIDNRRLSASSSVRCVGPTVLVDGERIASPITIKAIGNPKDLYGGVNIPRGVLDELRLVDPNMVKVELVDKHHLPAFSGGTIRKFAKEPPPKS
ncbi:MAG: DUF881 domain-containing protein [Armatimonadetes bacterium]|nr:DUF881 domain-containing protein [Armatimonadota bacterium]